MEAWPATAHRRALSLIDGLTGRTIILPLTPHGENLPSLVAALDWRLLGRLSRRLSTDRFAGHAGHRLLLLLPKEAWPAVVLLGTGTRLDPDDFSAGLKQVQGLGTPGDRVWVAPNPAPSGWQSAAPQWLQAAGEIMVAP